MQTGPDLYITSKLTVEVVGGKDAVTSVKQITSVPGTYLRWGYKQVEEWKRLQSFGEGGFGTVYTEECISGQEKGSKRAVKEVKKAGRCDYKREIEAAMLFSHPDVRNSSIASTYAYR
jgi:hypothetical protein